MVLPHLSRNSGLIEPSRRQEKQTDWFTEEARVMGSLGRHGMSPPITHQLHSRRGLLRRIKEAVDSLQLVAVGAVQGNQVFFCHAALRLAFEQADADAVRPVFPEALELRFGAERVGQVRGLADVDSVVGGPAVGAVVLRALRHELHGRHRLEPCFQRPGLEAVLLARFSGERYIRVLHGWTPPGMARG